MERSGTTPQHAADTSHLADLVRATGPFLSLALATEADIDNAGQRSELRWRAVREEAGTHGAPEELFQEQTSVAVQLAVNADTDELMEKFREEHGQGDRATEGSRDTLSALAMGAVDVLLVAPDDPADARTAWFGPDPSQLAVTADDLRGLGVDEPVEGRLVDGAVRTVLATGAGIRVLEGGAALDGGMGAILRWSA